jgi:outer membrane protein insertion porin family
MVAAAALTWRAVRLRAGVRAFSLLLILTAFIIAPVNAQSSKYEGKRLIDVRFDSEDKLLVEDDLKHSLEELKIGEPLQLHAVRTAIERLYATGRYADIAVDAREEDDGVILTFQSRPARFIRNVVVTGVDEPPSPGQLVNATKLQLGTRYDPAQVRQSVENLMETLRANGFYLAKITPEIDNQFHQQVDITLRVDTGDRAKYSTPVIKGAPQKPIEDIVKSTRWRKLFGLLGWKEVTETRTDQGLDRIRRAYQKKDYLMARVSLEQMEFDQKENRVIPTISIDSANKVIVRTRGAKISRGRLRELVPIYQELTVDKDLLVEGKRELTEYMQSRGFFEAEVDVDMATNDQDETVIEYSFFPGERHKVVAVEIAGNNYFDDRTLRERMFITPASFPRYRRGRFSQDFVRRDVNAIKALYQTNGFRDVDVKTDVVDDYKGRENDVAVFFYVTEGPQWFVAGFEIEGVDATIEEDLRAMMQSTEGQPYSELSVATDQDTILSYFFNSGYPDATLEVTAVPAPAPNQMALKYVVRPGERQYVRDVLISGLQTTDSALVRARIDLVGGDPLSQSSMIESQRRLYDLGIFARVDTALQNPEGDTDNKFVLYRFEEARKYSVNTGFGAQIARIGRGTPSLDTPTGTTGFSPRVSLGISRSNLLGIGHTLSLQTRWSNIQRRGFLSYLAPQFKGNDRLNVTFTGLYDDSRDIQTFNSRRQEGAVQLAQRLTKANTAQYRIAYRRVTVSDLNITPSLIPLFAQPVQLVTLSGTFIQDRRDDPVDARRGIYNTIDMALASDFWGDAKGTFTRALGRNATYHRVGKDLIFARSTSFGLMLKLSGADVPLPERFFAGGATSHRGFSENQAGPRDLLTGFPLGGKALFMNNHELRFPLLGENIGGVFFHDAGNVYSDFKNISFRFSQRNLEEFDYMVHALGFGVRYRTPIGPVRVDLAYSMNSPRFVGVQGTLEELLNPPPGGLPRVEQRISRLQFHFSLGQLF